MRPAVMSQVAPYPHELADLVERCQYRPGWTVRLEDDCQRDNDAFGVTVGRGMTLIITTRGFHTYRPERGEHYSVNHYVIVPAATYSRDAWRRWLFDQFVRVELHEAMEFFGIGDEPCDCTGWPGGPHTSDCSLFPTRLHRPYRPLHAPGADPYVVTEETTDVLRRTRPNGTVVE